LIWKLVLVGLESGDAMRCGVVGFGGEGAV